MGFVEMRRRLVRFGIEFIDVQQAGFILPDVLVNQFFPIRHSASPVIRDLHYSSTQTEVI